MNIAIQMYKHTRFKICLVLSFLLFLSACSGGSGGQTTSSTPTTRAQGTAVATTTASTTSTPGIGLGTQKCPAAVSATSYWDALIPTQANVTKVEKVMCGNLKGVPTLQALVTVRHQGTGSILDAYVYDDLGSSPPKQLLKLLNLTKGDARISGYNTLLTAEVDQNSSANAHKSDADLTPDLAREFKWSDSAGTLVQIAFPGIFPDLTRYQAEADQAQVNQGTQPWKLNAALTAQSFGASLLKWDPNAPASVLSGGGTNDAQAVVSLKNPAPGGGTVKLTMARLESNTNGGIWIITNVEANGLAITRPQSASLLHSPATISGSGNAFEGVIGPVTILDHLYTTIGQASAQGVNGNGQTTFSTSVTYQPTFKNGAEEGVVMLATANNASGGIATAIMTKVLLQ